MINSAVAQMLILADGTATYFMKLTTGGIPVDKAANMAEKFSDTVMQTVQAQLQTQTRSTT